MLLYLSTGTGGGQPVTRDDLACIKAAYEKRARRLERLRPQREAADIARRAELHRRLTAPTPEERALDVANHEWLASRGLLLPGEPIAPPEPYPHPEVEPVAVCA